MKQIHIILAVVAVLAVSGLIWYRWQMDESRKRCSEGPAFYCANKNNWNMCAQGDKHKYEDFCCKSNEQWMDNTGTKDPDPHTNGFIQNCGLVINAN